MQVLPTAPSPTVTHLMNLEALEAILENTKRNLGRKETKDGNFGRREQKGGEKKENRGKGGLAC